MRGTFSWGSVRWGDTPSKPPFVLQERTLFLQLADGDNPYLDRTDASNPLRWQITGWRDKKSPISLEIGLNKNNVSFDFCTPFAGQLTFYSLWHRSLSIFKQYTENFAPSQINEFPFLIYCLGTWAYRPGHQGLSSACSSNCGLRFLPLSHSANTKFRLLA